MGWSEARNELDCRGARRSWKKHSAEEIVEILYGVSNALLSGVSVMEAIRQVALSPATYFCWRARYGRLDADHLAVIKRLEAENARLRRALAALENEALL